MNTTYIKNLKTPIAVIGLGKSGLSAHKVLLACGHLPKDIVLFDEKSADAQMTNWNDLVAREAATWVISPGVPLKSLHITQAQARGVHITSEISLAASLIEGEKLVGITGSVGKSTVTSILGVGAKTIDVNCFIGGNLGTPFCDYALGLLSGQPRAAWVVLELSSYQLENCVGLTLEHSIITYLSANHLERYSSLHDYYLTKLKITEITRQLCLFNNTSTDCREYIKKAKCRAQLANADIFSEGHSLPSLLMIGAHNRDNYALAAQTALSCGWGHPSLAAMASYRGLPHRLEFVASVENVAYIDDSKATAMDSVLVATSACLEALTQNNKLFLLLGGRDKNLPWQELSVLSDSPIIVPVFFGECGSLAREKSGLSGEYFEKLGHAIGYCQKRSVDGDVVLLSPGGTSLDEFKNFEERGSFFKSLVLSGL